MSSAESTSPGGPRSSHGTSSGVEGACSLVGNPLPGGPREQHRVAAVAAVARGQRPRHPTRARPRLRGRSRRARGSDRRRGRRRRPRPPAPARRGRTRSDAPGPRSQSGQRTTRASVSTLVGAENDDDIVRRARPRRAPAREAAGAPASGDPNRDAAPAASTTAAITSRNYVQPASARRCCSHVGDVGEDRAVRRSACALRRRSGRRCRRRARGRASRSGRAAGGGSAPRRGRSWSAGLDRAAARRPSAASPAAGRAHPRSSGRSDADWTRSGRPRRAATPGGAYRGRRP